VRSAIPDQPVWFQNSWASRLRCHDGGVRPFELFFPFKSIVGHPRPDGFVHGVPLWECLEDSLEIRDDGIVEIIFLD